MRRRAAVLSLIVLACASFPRGASAQFRNWVNLDHLNHKLAGTVVDFTHNHKADRRIYSPVLGMKRDLYVYLPPGYNPARAYPLIVYLHMAYVDEHSLIGSPHIRELDSWMQTGQFPQAIIAMPDGLIGGENRINAPHSLYMNGQYGRFEDQLIGEVVPFVMSNFSVRPEAEAHALVGASGGGFAAVSLAIRYPQLFGAAASIGGPLNLRYDTCSGNLRANFNPATFRWKETYDPNETAGVFYLGLKRVPAGKYIGPVFGDDAAAVPSRIAAVNPADLLFTADPQPGRPALYVNFAGKDNWNIDAEDESFLWLGAGRGLDYEGFRDPHGRHNLPYFTRNHPRAFLWLAGHILPPTP
jgi:poly(3-hydroxybutyrate) depolymerase